MGLKDPQLSTVIAKRMADGTVEEPLSSQESLPLSQETFDYFWQEYVTADQFHFLERIPSLENSNLKQLLQYPDMLEEQTVRSIIDAAPVELL
ncbi:hypothetical protein TNCV_3793511 [Trichonephila clavipes]|nr:hypothetical protein TNCV_3793511 [Trichonephila clavipes]